MLYVIGFGTREIKLKDRQSPTKSAMRNTNKCSRVKCADKCLRLQNSWDTFSLKLLRLASLAPRRVLVNESCVVVGKKKYIQ